MDAHALSVLEFGAIRERLARASSTPLGESFARALEPAADLEEVERRQRLTTEGIALFDLAAEPVLDGIADVRDDAEHAARGGVLTPQALHRVGVSIRAGLAARAALEAQAEVAPGLCELLRPLDPELAAVAEAVGRAVEDDGSGLRDNASRELRRLRVQLREGRHRVAEQLRRLARSSELSPHLQEDFVTERSGRPVLAVRASARGSVQGIVHDASSSGQTLFVEPLQVVELNNALSEAMGAEREEVERILRELSGSVRAHAGAVQVLVEATAWLDLSLACGAVSRAWRGAAVEPSGEVRLRGARHPLLDPAVAVPIDLDLSGLRALVLSGPNTGGKTVALKTLGLAALMYQAGLRPPAAEASFPVFDAVLADIGDEQSIEMSLSTFSGHVSNLVAILASATERSLVLVDELASGTDPIEGSALAQALLARLTQQARLTVVTTHYPELKELASATDGVANAATGFDPETHAPLYQVVVGRPGTSHALQVAEQLGLDPGVVADARDRVVPERLRIAELLAEAEAAEREAAERREQTELARRRAEEAFERARDREAALAERVAEVRASAAEERARALAEAERDLAEARAELRALRDEISAARRQERERRRATPATVVRAERERDRSLGAASERAARTEEAIRALDRPVPTAGPLAEGDPVQARDLGVRGTIAAIEGDAAVVIGRGGLRVKVPLERLEPDAQAEPALEQPPSVRVVAVARGDVSDELDVRGRRAHEAREAVRAFVDDAALAGLPFVRVVHGRGTGALRAAAREELRNHPLVERHEPDSEDGATVVHLASP